MQNQKLPIGYWVKKVDELLTTGIDAIQSSLGLTRTSWQVLNTIKEHQQIEISELNKVMEPFTDNKTLKSTLSNLQERSLLSEDNGKIELTSSGLQLHKLSLEKQLAFRQTAMDGITEQQYQATVQTLQKIAENIDNQKV